MYKILFVVISVLPGFQWMWAQDRSIAADTVVVSEHETVIRGETVPYRATVGTQPVWDEGGKAIAALHYTYYERKDVEDRSARPLMISFNGGPGSASVWMHIGYTGPRFLNIDPEGYPLQPYGVTPNEHSVLDVADILFVNPVNTGYSRILDEEVDRDFFFGVEADISYLAEWLNTFVSRNNRWPSPKFLIGESYGTTRVAGLALELQNRQWMYLNGVILVSPTNMGVDRDGPVGLANRIPYFAATAWYHEALEEDLQQLDLYDVLEKAEEFAINELLPAVVKGGFMEDEVKDEMAGKIARYSGLPKETVLRYNLDVDYASFWKLLLLDRGYTVGRLDSRYLGIDRMDAGTRPDYWAELTSWLHSFTPAINHYFRDELGFVTDVKYNMFGPVRPWDRSGDNTAENLRQAMAQNPFLNVLFQAGYYDGATTYFNAKYTMWQMDPSGKLSDRMRFEGYRSGHMMYLRHEDLDLSNQHLREFILESLPSKGEPARY
ncbi:MAG: carboxypeptidase [Saprospirales bacterium]|nr:MAG: carboxypeptidase [Saprospirales bacterium]